MRDTFYVYVGARMIGAYTSLEVAAHVAREYENTSMPATIRTLASFTPCVNTCRPDRLAPDFNAPVYYAAH